MQQWACVLVALLLLFSNLSNFTLVKFSCKSPLKEKLQESVVSFQISRGTQSLGLGNFNGVFKGFEWICNGVFQGLGCICNEVFQDLR